MRHLVLAFSVLAVTSGAVLAAEPAGSQAPPQAQPATPAVPAAAAAPREEKVCKTEPIANSRLRKRKVCVTLTAAQRAQVDQKENVRRAMRDYGANTQRAD